MNRITFPGKCRLQMPRVPVSFFSMVLGLAGLGNTWRIAHVVWNLPSCIGEAINAVAATLWAALLILYLLKWVFARQHAVDELRHPIDCSFVGLIGVATMLVAGVVAPYWRPAALGLFEAGAIFSLAYAVWQTGSLWQDRRHHGATTAVLYLPTVAGSFVTGTVAATLGFPEWGQLAFGGGVFSWLAIESVLAHRLYTVDRLPVTQRPSLGIQFAPPVVGGVTYMGITSGPPDLFAAGLVGYGILQALVILRLMPWIREQPFGPSYWAFTFGAASLATMLLQMLERGGTEPAKLLAPIAFIAANVVVGTIFVATILLLFKHSLFASPQEVQGDFLTQSSHEHSNDRRILLESRSLEGRQYKRLVLVAFTLAAMAIGFALASQIWGGLVPCKLCLDERIPYYLALPTMAVVLMFWDRMFPLLRRLGLCASAAIFFWSAYLGAFHSGVERKLWQLSTACPAMPQFFSGDPLTALDKVKAIPCDQIQWQLFGISMAGFNAAVSLLAAVLLLMAARPTLSSESTRLKQDFPDAHGLRSDVAPERRPAH